MNRSLQGMNVESAIFFLLFLETSGAVNIVTPPEDACACIGEDVLFNCTAEVITPIPGGGSVTEIAAQRWEIMPLSGALIMVDSASANSPAGYEIVANSDSDPVGLRVLSVDLSLNQANVTCIGYSINDLTATDTAPTVTLEVAGLSGFSCDVTCPQHYTSTDNQCGFQWTRPGVASCDSFTGYTLLINETEVGAVDGATVTHVTGVLEPFQSYTATVTAMSNCDSVQCSLTFVSPKEERPTEFGVNLLFNTHSDIIIITEYTTPNPPRVMEYSVEVKDENEQELLRQKFSGDNSSLSLDISSLQQCMSYTVSVTASNTGGSRTASMTLSLDFLTSLDVSCGAGEDECYLEATCVIDYPEVVNGCTVTYTGAGGSSQSVISLSGELTSRVVVSCSNQTILYVGQLQMTALGCVHNGTVLCPSGKDCEALLFMNGEVVYSTNDNLTGGTVATYSCNNGYELVGEETRTCLVDGTWTGAEPECNIDRLLTESQPTSFPGWAIAIIILVILVVGVVVIAATVLVYMQKYRRTWKAKSQTSSGQGGVEMSENVSYGPVKQSTIPSSGGSTAVPEYEELSDIHQIGIHQGGVEVRANVSYGPVKQSTIPSSGDSTAVTSETVEVGENVCYGPVVPPRCSTSQTVEYEEISAQ